MVEVPKLTVSEWGNILMEIQRQPVWRKYADREADYCDGNQIDSATLNAMKELGMAPIVEDLMSPTIDSVLGQEAKNRLDFVVRPQSGDEQRELAEAMNQRLNEAERNSGLDRACTEAFASQVKVGIGWVQIGFEHDPFKFPHMAEFVHRNEMFWDFKDHTPDLSNARWVVRSKWYDADQLAQVFPDKKDLLLSSAASWATLDTAMMTDGGRTTDLAAGFERERVWTIQEQEWRDAFHRRLRLSECWYRRWVRGKVMKTPDGRVVEYDESNPEHVAAVESGMIEVREAVYTKTRLSWWVGCHCMGDIENPYKHGKFPFVPFFGKREDMTGVPYGLARPMIPLQDEINARNTKMIWLLAAKRVTMTEGVADPSEVRSEAARPDAVHILNANKMREGGVFKVETDFELNAQQYNALVDKREAIKNVVGVYKAFEGNNSNANSGRAISALVEQSSQTLAKIYDNNLFARNHAGELLLSNVIQEMGNNTHEIQLKPAIGEQPKTVVVNQKDEATGALTNDIQRAMLKVALSDVPSTTSYRQQQNMMFAEILKSLPPELQAQLMDFYLSTTDMPDKEKAIERIRKVIGANGDAPDPALQQLQQQLQALQQQLQQAQAALNDKQADRDVTLRELDLREKDIDLKARMDAEKIDVARESAAMNHQSRASNSAQKEESDEAAEIDAIVERVTAKLSPALQQILSAISDMQREDRAEDALEPKE